MRILHTVNGYRNEIKIYEKFVYNALSDTFNKNYLRFKYNLTQKKLRKPEYLISKNVFNVTVFDRILRDRFIFNRKCIEY